MRRVFNQKRDMKQSIELNPISRITASALGEPGNRTFYLQARKGSQLVTLLCEKEQVRALAAALEQMLDELKRNYPKGANFMRLTMDMSLEEPVLVLGSRPDHCPSHNPTPSALPGIPA